MYYEMHDKKEKMGNTSIKSLVIVLGSLILGLILGVLISLTVMKKTIAENRMGPPNAEKAQMQFKRAIFRITDATEMQRAKIDSVLKMDQAVFLDMETRHREERKQMMDEMLVKIKPFLEEEQIERLEEKIKDFRSKRGKRKRKH